MLVLAFINFVALMILSLLHLSWGFGSKWGFDASLPTNDAGERVLNPKPLDSMVVGIGLMFFAFFHLIHVGYFELPLPTWGMNAGLWVIGAVFLMRAVGDFKYVGFFKKVKSTAFADMDSKYYSPLCVGMGIVAILLEILY